MVAGACHCHQAFPSFAACPKARIRRGPALGTRAHGPGWSRYEQPKNPGAWANDHPVVSWTVLTEIV